MKNKGHASPFENKLPMLVLFVIMAFIILLVSMTIAGAVSLFLVKMSIITPISENQPFPFILYLILVSLFTGTALALLGGKLFFKQINELAKFTQEVAAGNFNVRMESGVTKEMSRIAKYFNEMVIELSNIETLRSDFVSNISHEFKTPISSIRGFAKRLKKDNLSEEKRYEYLDIIISESERLTRLSNNVLLLSRLENTDKIIERTVYSLDEQLRKTILLLETQLLKKQLEVDVVLKPVKIAASEEMLSHLWINLLGNAIKFSRNGSTVKIKLSITGDEATVTISDTGIGMNDEVKGRIFDKFYQGDKSRATEGNGLGLSLVKRILELENGKISVDSKMGTGTCFTVSLPLPV